MSKAWAYRGDVFGTTECAWGVLLGRTLEQIDARIVRTDTGQWKWWMMEPRFNPADCGLEPTMKLAQAEVEKRIAQAGRGSNGD
jgi:hypothetical protein